MLEATLPLAPQMARGCVSAADNPFVYHSTPPPPVRVRPQSTAAIRTSVAAGCERSLSTASQNAEAAARSCRLQKGRYCTRNEIAFPPRHRLPATSDQTLPQHCPGRCGLPSAPAKTIPAIAPVENQKPLETARDAPAASPAAAF